MIDDNGEMFVATLYNVLMAPDLCDRLFSIITLMNSGHTCLFHKGFCTVYFGAKEDNVVTLPHSAVRKHAFMVKSKESSNNHAKKEPEEKENFFRIDASQIGAQIYQIFNGWGYCQCLGRCRPFLHFLQNLFNEQKG